MTKIVRAPGDLAAFGSDALGVERTVFGDVAQSDVLADNINADFLRGWGIVGAAEKPPKQDFNAAMYTATQLLAYLHQMGIAEWDVAQEYHEGSVCLRGGTIQVSRTNTNVGNDPLLDPLHATWTLPAARQLTNRIINGNFDIWQRGVGPLTTSDFLADRWSTSRVGTTHSFSQQSFALGQTDVPNNPEFYHRNGVTSVANAANFSRTGQPIEDVLKLSGKTVMLSFWAKADAGKDMAIEFIQNFGTTGAPSADVEGIGAQKVTLTASWQQFKIEVAIPSISGKTLGTDENDFLGLFFWYDAGSDFNTRTDTLGQQSGTFDVSQVQIEEGAVATDFESRTVGDELELCQRYYVDLFSDGVISIPTNALALQVNGYRGTIGLPTALRVEAHLATAVFTMTRADRASTDLVLNSGSSNIQANFQADVAAGNGAAAWTNIVLTLDAELPI